MEKNKKRSYASFKIYTEKLLPEELSNILGVYCDRGWEKGDKIITPKGDWIGDYYDFSCWIYYSKKDKLCDLEDVIDNMLNIFYPLKEKIVSLKNAQVVISGYIYFYENASVVSLSHSSMKKIVELGAEFVVELYDMKT